MAVACSTSYRCGSPLEKALADISGMGFRHVDLLTIDGWAHVNTQDLADKWEPTITNLDALLKKYQLKPIATNSGVSQQLHHRTPEKNARRIEETQALVRLMKHYGISVAAIQPRSADRERPWNDVLADCVATLRDQKAVADAAGVRLALELHIHSPFETLDQAKTFMEAMPEMPVVYDPTHFVMQGLDIRQTGWLMKKAGHVHIRDAGKGLIQEHLGQGLVDFDWVLNSLKDRGYKGHISIEYLESKEQDFRDDVMRLRDLILRIFPE